MNVAVAKNKPLFIIGAVALALVLVFVMLVLRPQLAKLSELDSRKTEELGKLEKAKLTLKRLQSVRSEAAATEAELISLGRELPDESEVPSLVVELEQMAEAAGLDFTGLGLGTAEEKDGYASVPVKLSATGNFYAVVDFIYRLEKMPRKLVVTKFELKNTDKYPALELNVELNAFKSVEMPATPAVPGQPPAPGTTAPAAPGAATPPPGAATPATP